MYDKIEWATVDDREKHFVECVRHGVAPVIGPELLGNKLTVSALRTK
jgi:hypothetical protein